MHRTIPTLLLIAFTAWGLLGGFAWILRDGLGPDAVESRGWEALVRCFWTLGWGPVFALLGLLTVAWSRRVGGATPEARPVRSPGAADHP